MPLGIDQLFHLYSIITVGENTAYKVEKNEVINVERASRKDLLGDDVEKVLVDLKGKELSLAKVFENAQEAVGLERLVKYSGNTFNCQCFTTDLLRSSGLLTPEEEKFINQPTAELFEKLPSYLTWISQATTDAAARFDTVIHGSGLLDPPASSWVYGYRGRGVGASVIRYAPLEEFDVALARHEQNMNFLEILQAGGWEFNPGGTYVSLLNIYDHRQQHNVLQRASAVHSGDDAWVELYDQDNLILAAIVHILQTELAEFRAAATPPPSDSDSD